MALPRRPMIVAMLVLAVIVIGFVAAALTNPWHLVGLYPLGHEGLAIAMLVLAGALVGGAGVLQNHGQGRRRAPKTSSGAPRRGRGGHTGAVGSEGVGFARSLGSARPWLP